MKHYLKLLCAVSTGTLVGCSQLSAWLSPGDSSLAAAKSRNAPLPRSSASNVSGGAVGGLETLFAQGRAAQQSGDWPRAQEYFARILVANPRHVAALNGMGVVHAQTGRIEESYAYFNRALAIDPQAAHLYNNLGYALLLGQRLPEAEAALRRARELNPESALTEKNLALLAQAKERAGAAGAPAIAEASRATVSEPAAPTLVAVAPGTYELRDPSPAPAEKRDEGPVALVKGTPPGAAPVNAAPAAVKARQPDPAILRGVRVEVSNGVGLRHMARRTAERLAPAGLVTARLTNQPGYHQVKTEIQYAPGQTAVAEALAGRLPMAPALAPVRQIERNIQVRLILGRDLVGQAIAVWLDRTEEGERVTTGTVPDGWLWG